MKFIIAIFLSMMALVSAAAIDFDLDNVKRELGTITARENVEIFSSNENGELSKLIIVVDGVMEGTLVETEDHGFKAFDANGQEMNVDDLMDGNDDDGKTEQKRWIPIALRIARLLAPIIKRWGKRAWSFFNCVGMNSTLLNCGDKILRCAQGGKAPWECASALACLGKSAKKCI